MSLAIAWTCSLLHELHSLPNELHSQLVVSWTDGRHLESETLGAIRRLRPGMYKRALRRVQNFEDDDQLVALVYALAVASFIRAVLLMFRNLSRSEGGCSQCARL